MLIVVPSAMVLANAFRLKRVQENVLRKHTSFQIDIDVSLKKDVSVLCRLPYDFLISRAFAFPAFAANALGFVACTGFYIAKEPSLPLCQILYENIFSNKFGSQLDQLVLNSMLCESILANPSVRESISLDNEDYEIDVFCIAGVRIGVLPKAFVERSSNSAAIFGNHHTSVIDHFMEIGDASAI